MTNTFKSCIIQLPRFASGDVIPVRLVPGKPNLRKLTMFSKSHRINRKTKIMNPRTVLNNLVSFVFMTALSVAEVLSQVPRRPPPEDNRLWYVALAVLGLLLAAAVVWYLKQRKSAAKAVANQAKSQEDDNRTDGHSFDMEEEMEWLRKNKDVIDRRRRKAPKSNPSIKLPRTKEVFANHQNGVPKNPRETSAFDEIEALPLPVFGFLEIENPKTLSQLPISNDRALLSAIEQTLEEDEEDEEVRDLATRILAVFQTRNSVEALTQVALYDLSAAIRSKAVTVLTDFDHETVFEPILLACADPTREVRAAAARGLTRLSFDRADAWTRILQVNEEGRMRHAARAAIEGGFVERSFDRLIHRDRKYAYEAFVLLALVIKAGEYDQIIEALKNHHDLKVKRAILHIIQVVRNPASLSVLYSMLEANRLPPELRDEIDKVIQEMGLVAA